MKRAWLRFRKHHGALVGGATAALIVALALLAPRLDAHSPSGKNVQGGLTELGAPLPPSWDYPLGTDTLGRCVCARLLHGARVSLAIGVLATLLALAIGALVGLLAGYQGGLLDDVLMRMVDLVLAFPFLLLCIALAAALRERASGMGTVLLVLGVVSWTTMARVIRGKVLSIRQMDFVEGARAVGAGPLRIVVRHIVPNVAGPMVVLGTISVAQLILAESTLTYLGLGVPPPAATWGNMLSEGRSYLAGAPWLVAAPGIAILLTVLAFNLLGEGLRDALDPKDKR
jgi:peptide/nickel transport system permease protein